MTDKQLTSMNYIYKQYESFGIFGYDHNTHPHSDSNEKYWYCATIPTVMTTIWQTDSQSGNNNDESTQ